MVGEDLPASPIEENDFDDLPEGDGVLIIAPGGRIMSANLQAERLLQMKLVRGQLIDLNRLIVDQYRPQMVQALNEGLNKGSSSSGLVTRISCGFGLQVSLVYSVTPLFDSNDQIIGVVFTFRDNTKTRQKSDMPRQIIQMEEGALIENLAEGVFTINTHWRITSFNRRAQEITGFKPDDVLGKFCWDIFRSDLCQSDCPLRVTMETGIIRMDQDVRILDKGGQRVSILVNTSVIKNEKGTVEGAIETFRPLSLTEKPCDIYECDQNHQIKIIGQSPAFSKLMALIPDVAASDATVIIEGESGTGKELFAKAIHNHSTRSRGHFTAVNCSALVETLLESELFGHVKAAFTGAVNNKVGRFELARGGTIFLDEIGEIKPEIQVKLLRVLEERVFERVGSGRTIPMEARIIAATNRNLGDE
ncbi:MAG: sigma 54-interacting transcriptional regulator, partial [Deltaproteobacteria bacterium]|nr:sigma 54-interacting transcriptional regulator [Deltaproteobacteria bacterium]